MNRFNMFCDLREHLKNGNSGVLGGKKFVLTGIIVQDPADKSLIDMVSKNFVKWAEMTGENFLFITFIHPSMDWRRSKYCCDAYTFNKNSMMADMYLSAEAEEDTIPFLRDYMDLPAEGSYLILTDNLLSNNLNKILISSDSLESQLQIITNYCNEEAAGKIHSPKDFNNLLRLLKADLANLTDSLLDIMTNYSSLISSQRRSLEFSRKEQNESARQLIATSKSNLRKYEGEDYEERVFHLFEAICVYKNIEKQNLPLHFEMNRYLDKESNKLYNSFQLLENQILPDSDELDYSGLTIYLGKIVENEINLSIGQMLRYALGVTMPEYFRKYYDNKTIQIISGDQTIDLNKRESPSSENQQSIPMGQLLTAYSNIYNSKIREKTIHDNPELDLDKLKQLDGSSVQFLRDFCRLYRNKAGHQDPDSLNTYNGAKDAFEDFLSDYIKDLWRIKMALQRPKIGEKLPGRGYIHEH